MLNTRIANARPFNKESAEEPGNKIDLKDEKVVQRILVTNNQVRKKIPQVPFWA